MNKPNNYDSVSAGGFTPVNLGGHLCTIKEVVETESRKGDPMLRVNLDFDGRDSQPQYFKKLFADDIRPDKKWPNNGGRFIMVENVRALKQFITCWEKSNNTSVEWGAGFSRQFIDTKIGAVYGEVENEYNDKITMRREIRWFCPYDDAPGASVPSPKYLDGNAPRLHKTSADGFSDLPATDEPDLPFN